MSDLGLPFDGADADAPGERRKKLIVIAAVAVLLVLAGVLLVPKLLGGDAEPAAGPVARSGRNKVTKPAPAKKKPVAKPVKKPKPFNGAIARDPFDPPYTPSSEKVQAATAPAVGTGTATTPATGTVPVTTTPTSGHTFTLLAVSGNGSSVTVDVLWDTKTYSDLKIGQRFIEDQFKVVTAASQCASFLYGDKEFALCEGEKQTFTSS